MMMYIILAFLYTCIAEPMDDPTWKEYKSKFGKIYTEKEEAIRYETWSQNVKEILMHNAENSKSYEQGMNQFTDMSFEEFKEKIGGCFKLSEQYLNGSVISEGETFEPAPSNVHIPRSINWTHHGYVTDVKDQKRCGSCYSFSATGALEGQWFKKTGQLPDLSEQQIVDCSGRYGNNGCQGGLFSSSWRYIKDTGGSDSDISYPYKAKRGLCRFKRGHVVATCRGYANLRSGDENALKQAVATIGPISIAIDASHKSFQRYRRGVYYEPYCGTGMRNLNHAVLLVGYGTEGGSDYWLVKNSYGTQFGELGYIKMIRNKHNNCGIATLPKYPLA